MWGICSLALSSMAVSSCSNSLPSSSSNSNSSRCSNKSLSCPSVVVLLAFLRSAASRCLCCRILFACSSRQRFSAASS
uniref:Putative secreted protein n=1 Tax=Anopheles darlingi TaxID=43151 RepID=A0A2M4DMH7_ANODA